MGAIMQSIQKLSKHDDFRQRHIAPQQSDQKSMLDTLGLKSTEELINETIPAKIRIQEELSLPSPLSEHSLLRELNSIAQQNKAFKSYIGQGYYNCITPAVIKRNLFENPGWYTAYTPYQSEISQGRLEALFHFQTLVVELTGLDVANASLLDEATAAAEAMTLLYRARENTKEGEEKNTFFVSKDCFPQTIEVLKLRAEPVGISIEIGDENELDFKQKKYYGLLLQYPNAHGSVNDLHSITKQAHENGIALAIASDLLALTLLKDPGNFGADVVFGSSQRLGVPLGYGGPHAAFFAVSKKYQRLIPGRIVGKSLDRRGQEGYRLALQTREQHIRRERATSNICTAQALLAVMAAMYAIYHGPKGLCAIAQRIHHLTQILAQGLKQLEFEQINQHYFDTLCINFNNGNTATPPKDLLLRLRSIAEKHELNFAYHADYVTISLDETTSEKDIKQILTVFSEFCNKGHSEKITSLLNNLPQLDSYEIPQNLLRNASTAKFLSQEVFHSYHSETALMRYLHQLEIRDLALNHSMIPLGSCTMKLNPAVAMQALSWDKFSNMHPFVPAEQATGYHSVFERLESYLATLTGMYATSLQPNSGAQGEYTGLMVIRAYHQDCGETQRKVALIPTSAHGTNPSSASMAGMDIVLISCDKSGNIDTNDLQKKASTHSKNLACIMITYPSTHGVFEENVQEVCGIIHKNGGLVYLDGANMNAQLGLSSPGTIGADVCHLNLHKTFSIPHGGGGPGVGPICVVKKLAPYLPGHSITSQVGGTKAIRAVSAAAWGSASIMLISYAYIRLLGIKGARAATEQAILSANYIKSRLEKAYEVLYTGKAGRVAHEMILDMRPLKKYGIEVEDIAKRLIDYGFHAPTMSWPVNGSLMIEPTESEPKAELDRFCEAMLKIRDEIQDVIEKKVDSKNNLLKNAPHPPQELASDDWPYPYSRAQAVYPLPNTTKYWPPVARIDNVYGDRNLVCSCPPVQEFDS